MYWRAYLTLMIWSLTVGSHLADAGTFTATSKTDAEMIKCRVRATQFLSHATFGPKPSEVKVLAERMMQIGVHEAKEEWIDSQLGEQTTLHYPKAVEMIEAVNGAGVDLATIRRRDRYKYYAWWDSVIAGEDQLRQRMAWALAQIFAIDQRVFNSNELDHAGRPRYLGIIDFYDTLVSNALGNYQNTLVDVSLHPVMGVWLSHIRNRKVNNAQTRFPDENYAREIQQLFTIGLYELKVNGVYERDADGNLIGTYTNEEIKEFARVFTGLRYYYPPDAYWDSRFYTPPNYHDKMQMFQGQHDTGEKVLHNGTVLPEGQDGLKDIEDGIKNLFDHPNCGPFVSRLLIQRLVKSNPSRGYIRRVATVFNDNGIGIRGDLAAVAKAILLDKEAENAVVCKIARRPWRVEVRTKGTEHSRLQEPVVRYTGLIRGLGGQANFNGWFMMDNLGYHLGQMAYHPHHVFNFYDKDHVPAELFGYPVSKSIPNGSIFAPELEIYTAVAANRIANRFRDAVIDERQWFRVYPGSSGSQQADLYLNLNQKLPLDALDRSLIEIAADPAELMQYLDLMLACGTLKDRTREIIANAVETNTSDNTVRARAAIIATLTASECAVGE